VASATANESVDRDRVRRGTVLGSCRGDSVDLEFLHLLAVMAAMARRGTGILLIDLEGVSGPTEQESDRSVSEASLKSGSFSCAKNGSCSGALLGAIKTGRLLPKGRDRIRVDSRTESSVLLVRCGLCDELPMPISKGSCDRFLGD